MGRYFEHLSMEEERKITKALMDKYGPMSLSELDQALRGRALTDHMEREMLTEEIMRKAPEIDFKIRYVDPQPVDYDGKKIDMIGLDEAGNWESIDRINKHWKLKSNKMEDHSKSTVQETEATRLLNRLCHLDDVAHGIKHTSRDIKVRLFGLEPEEVPGKNPNDNTPESWFAIMNTKLDSLQQALQDTGENLERINGGTSF